MCVTDPETVRDACMLRGIGHKSAKKLMYRIEHRGHVQDCDLLCPRIAHEFFSAQLVKLRWDADHGPSSFRYVVWQGLWREDHPRSPQRESLAPDPHRPGPRPASPSRVPHRTTAPYQVQLLLRGHVQHAIGDPVPPIRNERLMPHDRCEPDSALVALL